MARVGDLDFRQIVYWWIVDRGMKVFGRCSLYIKLIFTHIFGFGV